MANENRALFQTLAETRLQDAKALLDAGRLDAAYYLAGYTVECALKACICKRTREHDFPPRDTKKIYTHNLQNLSTELGAEIPFETEKRVDPTLAGNWNIVKDWTEESRYFLQGPEAELKAETLYDAVSDKEHGVLKCLSKYW